MTTLHTGYVATYPARSAPISTMINWRCLSTYHMYSVRSRLTPLALSFNSVRHRLLIIYGPYRGFLAMTENRKVPCHEKFSLNDIFHWTYLFCAISRYPHYIPKPVDLVHHLDIISRVRIQIYCLQYFDSLIVLHLYPFPLSRRFGPLTNFIKVHLPSPVFWTTSCMLFQTEKVTTKMQRL